MKASLLALAIVLAPLFAVADVPCQCAAALLTGNPSPVFDQASINWGNVAMYPSATPFTNASQNQTDCDNKCVIRASTDPNFANKAWWCSRINKPYDGRVAIWARLDPAPWHVPASSPSATYMLMCCAAQPPANASQPPLCPAGFQAVPNSPDPKRCAKPAGEIRAMPLPADRTLIGQWGFTLGSTIFQWAPPPLVQQQTASAPQITPCN